MGTHTRPHRVLNRTLFVVNCRVGDWDNLQKQLYVLALVTSTIMSEPSLEDQLATIRLLESNPSLRAIHEQLCDMGPALPVEVRSRGSDYTPGRKCDSCGATPGPDAPRLLKCARCSLAFYCDKDCQRRHWKQHKPICTENGEKYSEDVKKVLQHGTWQGTVTSGRTDLETVPLYPNAFEWDPRVWQLSRPDISADRLRAACAQAETSLCTITPLTPEMPQVSFRIMCVSKGVHVGVCVKKHGKMHTHWKYTDFGAKVCSEANAVVRYGRPFGAGDVVTVVLEQGNTLRFAVNGVDQGVAFAGFSKVGPVFPRLYPANEFSLHPGISHLVAGPKRSAACIVTDSDHM